MCGHAGLLKYPTEAERIIFHSEEEKRSHILSCVHLNKVLYFLFLGNVFCQNCSNVFFSKNGFYMDKSTWTFNQHTHMYSSSSPKCFHKIGSTQCLLYAVDLQFGSLELRGLTMLHYIKDI